MFDDNIDNQTLFASNVPGAVSIAPGQSYTFTVGLPECGTQVDLFYGDLLNSFAGGARYGSRLLDAV